LETIEAVFSVSFPASGAFNEASVLWKNCSASIIFLEKYNHIRNRKSAITTATMWLQWLIQDCFVYDFYLNLFVCWKCFRRNCCTLIFGRLTAKCLFAGRRSKISIEYNPGWDIYCPYP
jgi:hypothetical protein